MKSTATLVVALVSLGTTSNVCFPQSRRRFTVNMQAAA